MKMAAFKICDETFSCAAGVNTFELDPRFQEALAKFDKMSFHVIADNPQNGCQTKTIQLDLQHSCDGRNWVTRQAAAVPAITMTANTTSQGAGSDTATGYPLALVKAQLVTNSLAAAGTVHVVIYACARDEG